MRRSGGSYHLGELAHQYGFKDINARRVPLFIIRESFVNIAKKFEKQSRVWFESAESLPSLVGSLLSTSVSQVCVWSGAAHEIRGAFLHFLDTGDHSSFPSIIF